METLMEIAEVPRPTYYICQNYYLHCSKFIAGKCAESKKLQSGLVDVAAVDLQVAVTLLHMCGRMVHIARVTPVTTQPSL